MQIGLPGIFGRWKKRACLQSGRHLNRRLASFRGAFVRHSIASCKFAVLCALQLLPVISFGQSNDLADRLIRTYSSLESYCDEGFFYGEPSPGNASEAKRSGFERCARNDGIFKIASHDERNEPEFSVRWQDAHSYYWYYSGYESRLPQYERKPIGEGIETKQVLPILDMVLNRLWHRYVDLPSLEKWLGEFQLKPELSDDSLMAYERTATDGRAMERIWVSREDGLIRRMSDQGYGGMEMVRVRINAPLMAVDLRFDVPTATLLRHEVKGNPGLVAVTFSWVSFALGLLYWRNRYRTTGAARLPNEKWTFLLRACIAALAPALLYALVASSDESAPGIVQLFGKFGWLALYVYLLWLAVLFASAQPIARIRLRAIAHEPVLLKIDAAISGGTNRTQYSQGIWPAVLAMAGSAAVFLLAIGHTHRWPNGEWSGFEYKKYAWPDLIHDVQGTLNIGSQYLDSIVASVVVLGIGLIMYWLKRSRSKQLLWSVLLLWFIWAVCLLTVNRATSDSSKYDSRVYGAPFDWLYWDAIYFKWGTPLWTAFLANVISAFVLAGGLVFLVQRYRHRQICWPALVVLVISSLASYGVVTGARGGGGYEGWSGWPFMWYWWMDVGGGHTKPSALYADIAVAFVCVVWLTAITEWLHRLRNRHVVGAILVIFVGLSIILLGWGTHVGGRFSSLTHLGTPFVWETSFGGTPGASMDWPHRLWVLIRYVWWAPLGNILVAYLTVGSLGFLAQSVGSRLTNTRSRVVS